MHHKLSTMKKYLNLRTLIMVGIGMLAGYAYYYFIGCRSGSCSITSSPINSTLYGGVLGWLLVDMFPIKKNQEADAE